MKTARETFRLVGTHVALIVIIGTLLFPIAVMLSTAMKPFEDLFTWPPHLWPARFQLSNFITVWFGRYQFYGAFMNSVKIAVPTALLSILLGAPAAYAFGRFRFLGRRWFLFAILATQMFSPVVLIIPLYKIMKVLHLLNTFSSVIISKTALTLPMSIWLLTGYFQTIPEGLEEAAMIDGCSRLKALWRIVLPLSAPGIITAGIYAFILGWNDLIFALTFINDSSMRPITLALSDFAGKNVVYWNEMMAASVISVIPVALMFSFVQKFLAQGLTAGAVKG